MSRIVIPIIFILFINSICFAQQNSVEIEFNNGLNLLHNGQYEDALQVFERIYSQNNHLLSLWNMAVCKANLRRFTEALDDINLYLRLSGSDIKEEDRVAANQMITQLRNRLGFLKVKTNLDGASVLIDGNKIGITPIENNINLMPGPHKILIEKTGYFSYEREFEIGRRQQFELEVELRADRDHYQEIQKTITIPPIETEQQQLETTVEPETPFYKKWWFWTAVGVVLAGAWVGTVLAVTKPFEEDIIADDELRW